mmetsp:Transcript_19591/g.32123  ORF Transcript_19591/g.32123 Transcript_19591/m.32123 type:complete len:192 (-) Transcript_19591:156-731(-)
MEECASSITSQQVREFCFLVRQVAVSDFGLYIWPSSRVLADYVALQLRSSIQDSVLIEIGCGTGLPSLTAAALGAQQVFMLDLPSVIDNIREIIRLNEDQGCIPRNVLQPCPCEWGIFSTQLMELPPAKFILGADVFYDPKSFDDVLASVYFFLQQSSDAIFLTTYHERNVNRTIEHLLKKWSMQVQEIPL